MELESADGNESVASVAAERNERPPEQFFIRLYRMFEHPRYVRFVHDYATAMFRTQPLVLCSTVYSVDISPDGRYIATGSEHSTRLYDIMTGPRPEDDTMW